MKKRMTAKQLANLRPIKRGEIRNPKGISFSPEIMRIKKLTQHELEEVGSLLINKEREQLQQILDNPCDSALRQMMASIAIKAIDTGDEKKFNALMDRIVGKVKEKVELTSADSKPMTTASLTHEERMALIKKLDQKLKDTGDE